LLLLGRSATGALPHEGKQSEQPDISPVFLKKLHHEGNDNAPPRGSLYAASHRSVFTNLKKDHKKGYKQGTLPDVALLQSCAWH